MIVNPAETTVARNHINVLVWPVFGGIFGWLQLVPGVNIQIRAENEADFKARTTAGLDQLWDQLDQEHEMDADSFARFTHCWPFKKLELKYIPVPCAPPYLPEEMLDQMVDRAYSTDD